MANPSRRWERLAPPGLTLLFVAGLFVVARFFEILPLKPAPCGLRTLIGIPCLGCGGTRAVSALAHGEILEALRWNPLVVVAVMAIPLWFGISLGRILDPAAGRKRSFPVRWVVVPLVLAAVANWIYLIRCLPG